MSPGVVKVRLRERHRMTAQTGVGGRFRRSMALAICSAISGLACSHDDQAQIVLGDYQFVGNIQVGPCSADSPPKEWTTTLTLASASEADQVWLTEAAYGCTILASVRGSMLDGGGRSCPLMVAGFFQETFSEFKWNLRSKELQFTSALYAQGADDRIVTDCARAAGAVTGP